MESPGDATRAAFEAWRCMSAEHDAAYARVSAARDAAQAMADQPGLFSLRQQTLARAALAPKPLLTKRKVVATAVLLLAGAPLAALGIHAWSPRMVQPSGETFRTGIGQQADVTLPDGSTVTLDTASRLEVRYDGDMRRVLLDGQGWFRLKPSEKPFLVSAGGHSFTADRGSFDIRTDPGQVRAFAMDGSLSLAGGDSSVALTSGKLLAARGNDVTIQKLDDPASFTGWRSGLLQFDDVPVAQAASELNRYRRRPIRIADSRVASLHVSGAFRTTETPAFVDALTSGFPVRVKQDSSEGVVIASR
ncbi:FecR domain-containing protein [Sphingomonas sp. CGMCC 1.13654]|uniref:FecR domain-containing protein n=2 Tax=Sphingomonas chungangi TaxID=2683589 RepID=A0A838L5W6_9SPHN|nr:FecR domain-containing protein [Sphingomonas chungangi]MVW57748.1 iron transporter [Sphingomonas chungangi]